MTEPYLASAAPENDPARRSSTFSVRDGTLLTEFYDRPAAQVARELLGSRVVAETDGIRCVGEIVETEAYIGPEDEASHAHVRFGETVRNAAMFGAPGTAYVYRIYGVHWCLNAVTGPAGFPAAVLIRALRPVHGWDAFRERRGLRPDRELLRGPGNLTQAMAITGAQNGHFLANPPLRILPGIPIDDDWVCRGPRIGISRAVDWPLRFWLRDSRWVSRNSQC